MSADLIFYPGHTATWIKYLIPHLNQLDLSGLVLLAAFPEPSGGLYMWCGALMELWSAYEWLYVAVQLCGVE